MSESMNSMDCANDLLARMFLVTNNKEGITKQTIEASHDLFPSAIIFTCLIKRDLIVDHTNQEVYEAYEDVASQMKIPVLSPIVVSRTLCRYYGFRMIDKKIKGKKYRIYQEQDSNSVAATNAVLVAQEYVQNFMDQPSILNRINSDVYDLYEEWCRQNCQSICSRIVFSKLVCKHLSVKVKSVKLNGKTKRIYIKKVGNRHVNHS